MLVVISPAKRLDWAPVTGARTEPEFQADANVLAGHARQLTLGRLKALMDLSDDLARLNRDRFRAFAPQSNDHNAKQAVYAFAGDTYQGLDAATLSDQARDWAGDHLRILSGLYGVLRPTDAIQPYRLEMGSRLKTRRGHSLYAFWGDKISKSLNDTAEAAQTEILINCASQEYFGAVDRKRLKPRVITPQFYELKNGTPKIVSFFAKKARGAMARFVMENQATSVADIQDFAVDGYSFDRDASTETNLVFIRDQISATELKAAS